MLPLAKVMEEKIIGNIGLTLNPESLIFEKIKKLERKINKSAVIAF